MKAAPNLDTLRGQALKFLEGCAAAPEEDAQKGGKRKATARSAWMGQCMRSPAKGGQGKSMSDCSAQYKKDHPKPEAKK